MCGGQTAKPAHMSEVGVCGEERRVRHVRWPWAGLGNDSGGRELMAWRWWMTGWVFLVDIFNVFGV